MPKVVFDDLALSGVNRYIEKYTEYYEELYSDTWLWNEFQIIESYKREWYARYDEIIDSIVNILWNEVISYIHNETMIRWKSKIIIVRFHDEWALRIVEKIEIR